MECVGNLCSPCPLIVGRTRLLYVCLQLYYEKKVFCSNFTACIITMNISDKSKCKKHSFEASKITDKPSNVINCHSFMY